MMTFAGRARELDVADMAKMDQFSRFIKVAFSKVLFGFFHDFRSFDGVYKINGTFGTDGKTVAILDFTFRANWHSEKDLRKY